MAYGNVLTLDRAEVKIQGARGTAESVMTRPVVYPHGRLSWTEEKDEGIVAETLRSFHASDADFATVGVSRCRINLEFIATYEELPWWWCVAIKGGAGQRTGVATGSTPAGYTYTSTPSGGTDDLDVFTMKVGDGAVAYLIDRCVVNTMTLRWNPAQGGDAYWMVAVEIFGRFQGTTTFDAPAALTRHKIAAKGTKVFIDAAGGTIGATQATGAIRSGSVTITNNIEEKQFSEDDTVVSADFARGEQVITAELVREMTSDTEPALARAATVRKLRIEKTGDNIGSTPTTDYRLRIDVPVFRYTPRLAPNWQGQNRIATLAGRGLRNSGNAVPITLSAVNALATVTA
jgi:hypothetical protein